MSLKRFIDENPFVALVAVIVATGTLVAGVTAYFSSERLSSLEAEHKAELLDLSTKHRTELSDISSSLKQTIADLSSRLTSIERRLPGSGPVYLDVSTITIGSEVVASLPATYKPFLDKYVYVAIPEGGEPWKFSETTELEIASTIYGPELFENADLARVLREPKVDLWRGIGELAFYVKTRIPSKNKIKLTYFPAVYVEYFSKEQLLKRFSGLVNVLYNVEHDFEKERKQLDTSAKDLDTGKTDREAIKESNLGTEPNSDATAQIESEISKSLKLKQKDLDQLSSAYSADIVTFLMYDSLASRMLQSQLFEGMSYRVFSAQKKANVLYIHGQLSYISSTDEQSTETPAPGPRYDIDEEIFIFSNNLDVFIVRVITPDTDSRADASVWVRRWLAGLQIPLNH